MRSNSEIIEEVSEDPSNDFGIKEHVWKNGNLWWQRVVDKALNILREDVLKVLDNEIDIADEGISIGTLIDLKQKIMDSQDASSKSPKTFSSVERPDTLSSKDVCECGHEEEWHLNYKNRCFHFKDDDIKNIKDELEIDCSCKKFKSKGDVK